MRFSKFILGAVVASVANAVVQLTNSDFSGIAVGKSFTITWSGATSAVTLNLKTGPSTALTTVSTIASGLTTTSFVWTPASVPSGTYAIEIISGSEINYSVQFAISGGTSSSVTVSTTKASTSATVVSTSTTSVRSSSLSTVTTSASSSSSVTQSSTTGSSASTTASSSTSASRTSTSTTSSSSTIPTSNAAAQYGSPFALVALGLVAIAGLN